MPFFTVITIFSSSSNDLLKPKYCQGRPKTGDKNLNTFSWSLLPIQVQAKEDSPQPPTVPLSQHHPSSGSPDFKNGIKRTSSHTSLSLPCPVRTSDMANRWSHGTGSISTPSFQGCSQSCNSYAYCTNHNYVLQMHAVFVWGCYPKRGKVSETFPLAGYPNSPQGSEGRVKCRKELAEAPSLSAFSFKLCRIKDRCLCCPCDGTIWTHFCPSELRFNFCLNKYKVLGISSTNFAG